MISRWAARAEPAREINNHRSLEFMCRADFHSETIIQTDSWVWEQPWCLAAGHPAVRNEPRSDGQSVHSRSANKAAGRLLAILPQHTAETNQPPPPRAEKAPLKQKQEREEMRRCGCECRHQCICLRLRLCFTWPSFFFFPKHVFDICMLDWLNLLLRWKFPKCYAMFQSLSSAVLGPRTVQTTEPTLTFQSVARAKARTGRSVTKRVIMNSTLMSFMLKLSLGKHKQLEK